jgi:hypothetical protein
MPKQFFLQFRIILNNYILNIITSDKTAPEAIIYKPIIKTLVNILGAEVKLFSSNNYIESKKFHFGQACESIALSYKLQYVGKGYNYYK